jgi:Arc/MetJ-type ribon-helix-helix transcriptional regulator
MPAKMLEDDAVETAVLSFTCTPALANRIRRAVRSGKYSTISEVVRAGIKELARKGKI